MGIQLLSISHKTAPLAVRELFAFTPEQQAGLCARRQRQRRVW